MRLLALGVVLAGLLGGCGGTASQGTTVAIGDVESCLKKLDGVYVTELPLTGASRIEHATGAFHVAFPLDGETPGSAGIVLFAPSEEEAHLIPAALVQSAHKAFPSFKVDPDARDAFHIHGNAVYAWLGDHADSSQKTLEGCLAA